MVHARVVPQGGTNLEDAILQWSLLMLYYNFARIHKTLRVTPSNAGWPERPCLESGRNRMMADSCMPKPEKRGHYKSGVR
jgi:hypothetical protein